MCGAALGNHVPEVLEQDPDPDNDQHNGGIWTKPGRPGDESQRVGRHILQYVGDNVTVTTPSQNDTEEKEHVSLHLVSWNFDYIEGPLIISLFVLAGGLLKIGK